MKLDFAIEELVNNLTDIELSDAMEETTDLPEYDSAEMIAAAESYIDAVCDEVAVESALESVSMYSNPAIVVSSAYVGAMEAIEKDDPKGLLSSLNNILGALESIDETDDYVKNTVKVSCASLVGICEALEAPDLHSTITEDFDVSLEAVKSSVEKVIEEFDINGEDYDEDDDILEDELESEDDED